MALLHYFFLLLVMNILGHSGNVFRMLWVFGGVANILDIPGIWSIFWENRGILGTLLAITNRNKMKYICSFLNRFTNLLGLIINSSGFLGGVGMGFLD